MKTCYITLAAGVLATANATSLQTTTELQFFNIKNLANKVSQAVKNAAEDVGDFFTEDVADFFTEDVADFFIEDIPSLAYVTFNWTTDGSNWEALWNTVVTATVTGFSGNWEEGWEMFIDPEMYWGDTWDQMAED